MKKLMFAAVAALAMVGAANAAPSYGIPSEVYVSPYKLDADPGDGHAGWYSSYVMKQEDAQKAMGTTETVTYETMAEWLGKNFADNQASVIENAEQMGYDKYSSSLKYVFGSGSGDISSGLKSAICAVFYDDGANVAYNVMPNTAGVMFIFNDAVSSSGWQAVPEPTSGLLLLLGSALLALRRKSK